MRLSRLLAIRPSHQPRPSRHQPLPAGRNRRHQPVGGFAGRTRQTARPGLRRNQAPPSSRYQRSPMHRLHQMHPALSGRCHTRRSQTNAQRHSRPMHRLRTLHSPLSGQLHHPATSAKPRLVTRRRQLGQKTLSNQKPAPNPPGNRKKTTSSQTKTATGAIKTVMLKVVEIAREMSQQSLSEPAMPANQAFKVTFAPTAITPI